MCFEQVKVTVFSSAKCNLFKKIFSPEINLLDLRKIKQLCAIILCTVNFQMRKAKSISKM